ERGELLDPGDEPGGGDGDPPRRKSGAPGVLEQLECPREVVEVVQRLAHPHEDQVGGPAARERGGAVDLLDDLVGAEVAAEPQRGGGAEPAVDRATDLR